MKYQIGQYIMYLNRGVCQIEAIGKVPFLPNKEKDYYTLRPPFTNSNEHIYIPVNSEKYMKDMITCDEAHSYLADLKDLEVKPIRSSKASHLTTHYQELLSTPDIHKHLQLFKELWLKEDRAKKLGRRLGETERRFKRKIEELLSEEFAIALNESPALSIKRLYLALQF